MIKVKIGINDIKIAIKKEGIIYFKLQSVAIQLTIVVRLIPIRFGMSCLDFLKIFFNFEKLIPVKNTKQIKKMIRARI